MEKKLFSKEAITEMKLDFISKRKDPSEYSRFPKKVKLILDCMLDDTFEECQAAIYYLKEIGWTADYDLGGGLHNVRKLNPKEDNMPINYYMKALSPSLQSTLKDCIRDYDLTEYGFNYIQLSSILCVAISRSLKDIGVVLYSHRDIELSKNISAISVLLFSYTSDRIFDYMHESNKTRYNTIAERLLNSHEPFHRMIRRAYQELGKEGFEAFLKKLATEIENYNGKI